MLAGALTQDVGRNNLERTLLFANEPTARAGHKTFPDAQLRPSPIAASRAVGSIKGEPKPQSGEWLLNVFNVCFSSSLFAVAFFCAAASAADDFETDPINYSSSPTGNPVSQLSKDLQKLNYDPSHGYLPSLLARLNIKNSSQVLVFSKTSFQRERISPATPRALYFNDDLYVGYCRDGQVIEIAASDPNLGAVFYTLDQQKRETPALTRQTDNCLQCHASAMTHQVPGLLVRSVFPDKTGLPIFRAGTYLTTHESPMKERWGGWYVTGKHGDQKHLGNQIWEDDDSGPKPVSPGQSFNLASLADRFDTSAYLSPHSDIVALMVLEHQAEMHNLITRANYQTKMALRDQRIMNEALDRPLDTRSDSTNSRIKGACEPLVKYMLFCNEAPLTHTVEGTSSFAADFAASGLKDSRGRSLRNLDLRTRLLRYPCSYLIYSSAFDALPAEAKEYVYGRLHQVLSGSDNSADFSHLTMDDRSAILEILRQTKKDLPAKWH